MQSVMIERAGSDPHDSSSLPPTERNIFSSRLLGRRAFLGWARDIAIGGILLHSVGVDADDVAQGGETAIKYGPDIALAAAEEPSRARDTFEMWRTPEEGWKDSLLMTVQFEYTGDEEENVVVALGDSNIVGALGTDKAFSPVNLFVDRAREKVSGKWEVINIAQKGKTTEEIREGQLLSPEAYEAFYRAPKCDVWINAGGNDLSKVVRSTDEMEELEQLEGDPLKKPKILMKYVSRMMDNLSQFKEDYSDLLNALYDNYAGQIRQLVIMSAPDFSKAPAITSQYIDDRTYRLPLTDPQIRRLVHNISVRMNNIMFEVAQEVQKERGIRIIGINTFDNSLFGDDQHLSPEAFTAIADDAASRIPV